MNKQIKQLWVEALRSGKYRQNQGGLREERNFCCLGVLCDIHRKETGGKWKHDGIWYYKDEEAYTPREVEKWAGLKRNSSFQLAELNDNGNKFEAIADYIERHY